MLALFRSSLLDSGVLGTVLFYLSLHGVGAASGSTTGMSCPMQKSEASTGEFRFGDWLEIKDVSRNYF
jgi:hypothetical protein